MSVYVLILFLATSSSSNAGTASVNQEFNTKEACVAAGASLVNSAQARGNYVLSWGCFHKG